MTKCSRRDVDKAVGEGEGWICDTRRVDVGFTAHVSMPVVDNHQNLQGRIWLVVKIRLAHADLQHPTPSRGK